MTLGRKLFRHYPFGSSRCNWMIRSMGINAYEYPRLGLITIGGCKTNFYIDIWSKFVYHTYEDFTRPTMKV